MTTLPLDHLAALAVFAFVASFTPGPNTLMLLASGVNYGFRATIPHMVGITLGFPAMLTAIGFGLGAVFDVFPAANQVLKIAGALYLLWLAWRIATAAPPAEHDDAAKRGDGAARPLTAFEAAAFQWVNPKAWAMGVSALATYSIATAPTVSIAAVVAAFAVMSVGAVVTWAGFGVAVRRLLAAPRRRRIFNVTMALLLVGTLVPVLGG
ncbi:MAG: LysE family translocator [Pseudomonadota bacterium]